MLFISAGHNIGKSIRTGKIDPGAVANGYREADLTAEFRNLVNHNLDLIGAKYITDKDNESLAEYLERIKTGNGSTIFECHFDAASPSASGCSAIIEEEADRLDRAMAKEIVDTTSAILGIKNRGVITEAQSHRGRLGLMREEGIIVLLEIGFITNIEDINKYQAKKTELARAIALILKKYDDLIP